MADDNEVQVKIGADSEQLQTGVEQAADSMQAGIERMIELMQQMVEQSAASSAKIIEDEEKIAHAVEESSEESSSAFAKMVASMREQTAEVSETLEGFAKGIAGIQKVFSLLAEVAMVGFVGEQIADLGKEFAEYGEQTEIAARKTGLSTTAVQELGFAAAMTGVSSEGMNQALMRLSRAMSQAEGGSKQAEAAFEKFGLSGKELAGMTLDEVLGKVADKFAGTSDDANKAAVAMQLFGRQGADLIPLLDRGSSGIAELRQKAQELGVVMSEQDVEAGEQLNEKLKEVSAQMSALKQRAGSELAPAMMQIADAMGQANQKGGPLDEMFQALGEGMKIVTAVALTVVTAFEQLGDTINGVALAANRIGALDFTGAGKAMSGAFEKARADGDAYAASLNKLFAAQQQVAEGATGVGEAEAKKPSIGAVDANAGSGPSQVDVWKEQLQQQQEASGQYFKQDLAGEEAFWESKLSLVKSGSKEYLEVQHELYQVRSELAHQSLAQDLADMQQQMAAAENGSLQKIEIASREADRIGEAYGYQSSQYKAALAEMLKAGKEYSDAQIEQVAQQIDRQAQLLEQGIARAIDADKARYKAGEESSSQETANLIAEENQRYAIELGAIEKEMALYAQDSKQYQKLLDDKLKATEQHTSELQKINETGAQQMQQQWESAFKQIGNSLNSSILGMIRGTTTLQQAFDKTAEQMLSSMINSTLQMVERWLATEAAKTAATISGEAARASAVATSTATGMAAQADSATTTITNDAYQAAAGAYSALAGIPYVGPVLAPAAAAVAFAGVEAFGSGIASAEGGYYSVPNDMLANIHKDEMVLPAWAASGMRSMIGNGGGSAPAASGGDTHVHVNTTLNGNTDGAFKTMLAQNSDVVYDAVKQAMRSGRR